MPFFWSKIAKEGQLYGNQHKGSIARVTNGKHFSYPGYNETLCGFADPRIDSNDKKLNPNIPCSNGSTARKATADMAAFTCWDVFPYIFNGPRCGFYINSGYDPFDDGKLTPRLALLNQLKAENPRPAGPANRSTRSRSTQPSSISRSKNPRLLFVSLNETDSWGHEGKYEEYLRAANRYDLYVKTVWDWVQSQSEYQGKTTLIVSPDHGRGDAPVDWKSHGKDLDRSQFIWMGFLGPDTPALGERSNIGVVTQSQLAATLAALLGEDYCAAVRRPASRLPTQSARSSRQHADSKARVAGNKVAPPRKTGNASGFDVPGPDDRRRRLGQHA